MSQAARKHSCLNGEWVSDTGATAHDLSAHYFVKLTACTSENCFCPDRPLGFFFLPALAQKVLTIRWGEGKFKNIYTLLQLHTIDSCTFLKVGGHPLSARKWKRTSTFLGSGLIVRALVNAVPSATLNCALPCNTLRTTLSMISTLFSCTNAALPSLKAAVSRGRKSTGLR